MKSASALARVVALMVIGLSVACRSAAQPAVPPALAAPAFTDIAGAAGLDFRHVSGAAGEFLLPEIMGGGGGFLDYDGDGRLDVFLVQSGRLAERAPSEGNRLYRNEGAGRFRDVTQAAGVGHKYYGMGCAAGDYDNDGDVDLYVTNLGPNMLYRNEGDGTFSDRTAEAGVGDPGWSTSAAFVDYDADGDLDLVVANYVQWSNAPALTEKRCLATTGARDYCSPTAYAAPSFATLYRNEGHGKFRDVSVEAGLHAKAGTGLGVVCLDLDGDGRMDLYVANDQMPSFAWIQDAPGHFSERAVPLGIAVDESGAAQAGMGVSVGDIDSDGDLDLWKVHLNRESHILYLNQGGRFDDATSRFGLSALTRPFTGFGTALFDLDLDGRLDIFVADGRVQYVADATGGVQDVYAEPDQVLRQVEGGRFADVTAELGPALALVENGRGAAFGDVDNDGDLDVLVVNRDGPVRLLRNDAPRRGGPVTLRLIESHGRDALGARAICQIGDRRRAFSALAAYSYCATNDPRIHVGLGAAPALDRVEVTWPDGTTGTFGPFAAGAMAELRQGQSQDRPDRSAAQTFAPQKPEFLEVARRLRESRNPYFGRQQLDDLRRKLDAAGANARARVQAQGLLSLEYLRLGQVDEAIPLIEAALSTAAADASLAPLRLGLYRIRGLVWLRKAEIENCVRRHNAECCLFPLRGGGLHAVRGPAQQAMASYLAALSLKPDDLKLRWLLNLAAMALGEYPAAVPEAYRIPEATFASDAPVGRFQDVAPALGLATFNLAGGAIVEDFDLDGLLDILISTSDPEGSMSLFGNRGDGRFEDRSVAAGLDDQLGGLDVIGGDYDGDGDTDVLVLRGAWLYDDGRIRMSLLRNAGDGTFRDVTVQAGLARAAAPTQAATWGDFDNDGDLDLYVGHESRKAQGDAAGDYPSQLFRNAGDGTFRDVAPQAGVTNDRYAKGVAAGDYDNDGDLDLYVSNVGPNRLYRNDGGLKFTDVAEDLRVTEPRGRSFATWFFDYDNDGWLDLFVAGFDATVDDVAAGYLGLPESATRPCLYRNLGGHGFEDVARKVGLDHAWLPMGANFGDIDNDGWLDIYLGTGDPDFQTLMPNVLLRNDGGRRFQDVTAAAGLGHLQKGHGVAFADLDQDGDQDIFHQLGGFYPGDRFNNALFLNPGTANHYLVVQLVGQASPRLGTGARIDVTLDTPSGPRHLHRAAGSVSSFGGSPSRQEIGLGDATRVVRLDVVWPVSKLRQSFEGVPLDAAIRVVEGRPGIERLPFRPSRIGAGFVRPAPG